MEVWDWFTSATSFDKVLSALGLGVLAFLFARDLVITRGQHLRRVEDLVKQYELRIAELIKHHEREAQEKDRRYGDLVKERDYWRSAYTVQEERADKATDTLAGSVEVTKAAIQALDALDQAAKGV